jgi:uncharacterized protein YggE
MKTTIETLRISRGFRTALLLVCAILAPVSAAAQTRSGRETDGTVSRTVTVIGQGSVSVQPDIAMVQIGVETFKPDVTEATAENRRLMQRVFETLLSLGIEEQDMQTSSYNIHFERRFPETDTGGTVSGSYRVANMLSVLVRDLQDLGRIIDSAVEAGANQLWGVQFDISNPELYRRIARTEAVDDAREKARQLASAAGLTLGEVLSISEVVQQPGFPQPFLERSAATPIAAGELSFTLTIEVVFAVR